AGGLERLHVAADRPERHGSLHATGGAGQPLARACPGQRGDDGRRGADDVARGARLPGPAALLHPRPHPRQRQGMTPHAGRALVLLVLALALPAGTSRGLAQPGNPPSMRVLDAFEDVTPWT